MKKVAVVTDTSFHIDEIFTKKNKNLKIISLPLIIDNEKTIYSESEIEEKKFKELVKKGKVKTSQASIGLIEQKWDEYLKEYDFLIFAGISKGLSGMYNSTLKLSKDKKYKNKVLVIDTDGVSIILEKEIKYILEYIKKETINNFSDLKGCGKNINKIKKRYKCLIFPKSLETLKNGGRITKAASLLSNILKIYPILILKKGIIDKYGIMKSYIKGIRKQIIYAVKSHTPKEIDIVITDFDDPKVLDEFNEMLKEFNFKKINYRKMPNVVLAHLGYNTIAFNIWLDE